MLTPPLEKASGLVIFMCSFHFLIGKAKKWLKVYYLSNNENMCKIIVTKRGALRMTTFSWGKTTRLVSLAIRIKNRDKMIEFYKLLGFDLKREENELAIFGTREKDSELLLLEESPRAKAYDGELRKMLRLTMIVPNRAELTEIIARVQNHGYPIKELFEEDARTGFIVVDPEHNEIEMYCPENEQGNCRKPDTGETPAKPFQKEKGYAPILSEGAYFIQLKLNVRNIGEERIFLQDIVGFIFDEESSGFELMEQGRFGVELNEEEGQVLGLPTDQVHGLDFVKFSVDQADFDAFSCHLKEMHQEHFIDGKKSIITLYGPLGVEWWFAKRKD